MTAGALVEVFHRTCKAADLRVRGPHTLKHTFLSRLAMRGAPPIVMQELGAHQDLATTQRYAHMTKSPLRDAIQLLEPVLLGADGEIAEKGDAVVGK